MIKKLYLPKSFKALSFIGLVLIGSSYLSCRKPHLEQHDKGYRTMSVEMDQAFDLNEIVEKLPQTVLYDLGDDAVFYINETKVASDQDAIVAIQFPINHEKTKFLYAIKDEEKDDIKIYVRNIYESSGKFEEGNYSAVEEILDLQTYHVHTQRYENNKLAAYKPPLQIAEPYWETCMLENGAFEFDNDGNIGPSEEKLVTMGYPPCGWAGGGSSGSIFRRFSNWIKGVLSNSSSSGSSGGYSSGNNAGTVFPPSFPGYGGGDWTPSNSGGGGTGNPNMADPYLSQPQTAPGFEDMNDSNNPWGPTINYTGPLVAADITDANGFLGSRITALKIFAQQNPYGLIDCNDLIYFQNQVIAAQSVSTYQIPIDVKNRISMMIGNNSQIYSTQNTFIQKLDYGRGVVNMDYFPVYISQLPKNQSGQVMTPLDFLEHFRKQLLADPNVVGGAGSTFEPYVDWRPNLGVNINETGIFNNHSINSLGAWVHINIPANDGTVLLSEYQIDHSNNTYWFTFTTMATERDGMHPVAGNRRFGIQPHSSGGWTFYLLGVDRVWGGLPSLANDNWLTNLMDIHVAFDGADNLWESVQNGVINFINQNQGGATLFSTPHRKIRAKYTGAIIPFLSGHMSFQQFKDALGCP